MNKIFMNIRKIGLGMALLGALCACEKDEEPIVFSAKLEVHEPLTVGRTFATLNGSVTLDGSATVKEVGFVYWEAGSPEEKTTVEGDTLALSEVTVQLEGLRMETEYEYQLFVGNGQSQKKSSVSRFSTTRTGVPLLSEVSYDTATGQLSALIKDDGIDGTGDYLEQKGFCWGTRVNPTISGNMIEVEESGLDMIATFPEALTETIYVRAFAQNNIGYLAYGPTLKITPGEEPVEPGDSTEVKWALGEIAVVDTLARTFQGTVATKGDAVVSAWGFCWNQAGNPTIEENRVETDSTLVANLTDLLDDQTYYVKAYLVANDSVIYSPELTFLSHSAVEIVEPTVGNVSLVDENTYTMSASVVNDGGSPVTKKGFCWSDTEIPTLENGGWVVADENFMATLQDYLMQGKTYSIRAFATNEAGMTGYSEVLTLTIKDQQTGLLSVLGQVTISDGDLFSCEILDEGASAINYKGFCWSKESAEPVWDSAWSVFTPTSFSSRIELSPGHYYLRAFAVNGDGISYSEPVEVTIDSEDEGYLPLLGEITPVDGMSDLYQCEVLDDRGMEISVRGFCWTNEPNILPTIWSGRQEVDELFIFDATNLSSAGNYYVRAYVVTASGEIVYSTSTVIKR